MPIGVFSQKDSSIVKTPNPLWNYGVNIPVVGAYGLINFPDQLDPFHTTNDLKSWKGMDKQFHAYCSYAFTKTEFNYLKSLGYKDHQAGAYAFVYNTSLALVKEYMDGRVGVGGFSGYDVGVSILGSAFYLVQQRLFGEEKVMMKYSFIPSPYQDIRPDLLGGRFSQFVRDYNAMSVWYSVPLPIGNKYEKEVDWLGVAIGFSGDGLYGAYSNDITQITTPITPVTERSLQVYLAPDINFRNIRTNNKWVRAGFFLLDFIHLPFPNLVFDRNGVGLGLPR